MPIQSEGLLIAASAGAPRPHLIERVGCELIAEGLRAGREVRFRVSGSSMLPALWPGDTLVVTPVSTHDITDGQLIVFTRDGRLFVHRLVQRSAHAGVARFITRGDALDQCDPPLHPAEVLGTVTEIYRNGCEITRAVNRPSLFVRSASYAVRRSDAFRRVMMKIHSLWKRYGRSDDTRCQA
jgi:signal peptidase I